MKSRTHNAAMAELYRSDPALALDVLNSILQDGDLAELLIMLRQLTQAFGGMQAVVPKGNPALSSLTAILKAMGLRLAVLPLDATTPE